VVRDHLRRIAPFPGMVCYDAPSSRESDFVPGPRSPMAITELVVLREILAELSALASLACNSPENTRTVPARSTISAVNHS